MRGPSNHLPTRESDPAVAATGRDPLLERPAQRPAGIRDVIRDLGGPFASKGVIGLIFSASGPIAVTLAVGAAGGLSQAQMASWVCGIFLSAGLATILMSLIYRQPLGFAWSIPGTVLLGPSLQHLSFAEVVGAFFTTGVLVLALGATGVVRRIMAGIPMPIVMAMVAAVFLRFGTDIISSTQANPVVAGPMVLVFILLAAIPALGRRIPPVLGTLIAGIVAVAASGQFALDSAGGPIVATPVFTAPEFTWAAQLELVVPLAITVLIVQNGQGVAVLRSAGHRPPVNAFAMASGGFSILNACFGARTDQCAADLIGTQAPPVHRGAGLWFPVLGLRAVRPDADPFHAGHPRSIRAGLGRYCDAQGAAAGICDGLRHEVHHGCLGDVRSDHFRP